MTKGRRDKKGPGFTEHHRVVTEFAVLVVAFWVGELTVHHVGKILTLTMGG